jgi:hypothetical protein
MALPSVTIEEQIIYAVETHSNGRLGLHPSKMSVLHGNHMKSLGPSQSRKLCVGKAPWGAPKLHCDFSAKVVANGVCVIGVTLRKAH